MICFRFTLFVRIVVLLAVASVAYTQAPQTRSRGSVGSQGPLPIHEAYGPAVVESGSQLFVQNCAFCHGKDAGGGETGPDLTRSKLVSSDTHGENIGPLVREGRPQKGMPGFNLPDAELASLVAFIHHQQDAAMSQTGTRKGVDTADLETGNAEAGKLYFNGAGRCAKCHAVSEDLAGVASRYQGLALVRQMLYPSDVKAKVTVKPSSGNAVTGNLAYLDEFTVGMVDATGAYRSWSIANVKYTVDNPSKAHLELLGKYTDADIHNLFAYMQMLQ